MSNALSVKIEPMTTQSFHPFGQLLDSDERPQDERLITKAEFVADGVTTLGVIWQPCEGVEFHEMERHFNATQTFIQLSGSPSVVAVALPTDTSDYYAVPEPEEIRAFLIDPSRGFVLNRGTWHSLNRYVLHPPGATFISLNTSPNPTQVVDYSASLGLIYSNMGSDELPDKVNYGGRFGITLKLEL